MRLVSAQVRPRAGLLLVCWLVVSTLCIGRAEPAEERKLVNQEAKVEDTEQKVNQTVEVKEPEKEVKQTVEVKEPEKEVKQTVEDKEPEKEVKQTVEAKGSEKEANQTTEVEAATTAEKSGTSEQESPSEQAKNKKAVPYGLDGGGVPSKEVPNWLVPMYLAGKPRSQCDGRVSGHAIRLTSFSLLAHIESVNVILESLRDEKPKKMPRILGFEETNFIDLVTNNKTDDHGFLPEYNSTIKEGQNIAVFRIMRTAAPPNEKGTGFLDKLHPLKQGPPLPVEQFEQWGQQCYVQAWGQKNYSNPIAQLTEVTLKELDKAKDCQNSVCKFSTVTKEPGTSGSVCGRSSFLGAPVLCYQGKETRLSYVIVSANTYRKDMDRHVCATEFQALDLSKQTELIWNEANTIQTYYSKRDNLEKTNLF